MTSIDETPQPQPPTPPRRAPWSRERRAAVGFYGLGVFTLVFWFVAVGAGRLITPGGGTGLLLVFVPVLAFGTGYGIDNRLSWGLGAMVPLLWLEIVAGAADFLIGLSQSRLTIPVGLIVGVWALLGRPERPQGYRLDAGATVLVIAFLFLTIAPLLSLPV